MKYTVVWKNSAENALAEIWLRAANKGSVTRATDNIDAILRNDPLQKGRSHLGSNRLLFSPPLGVIFRVDVNNRIVRVLAVWWIPSYTTNGAP